MRNAGLEQSSKRKSIEEGGRYTINMAQRLEARVSPCLRGWDREKTLEGFLKEVALGPTLRTGSKDARVRGVQLPPHNDPI